MKTLVVYYSRTGFTKKAAEYISKKLKADIDEITDQKDRAGPINYLKACKDAAKKNLTEIKTSKDQKNYDLIIIGSPTWVGRIAPAVRTYLTNNKVNAAFATGGSTKSQKTVEDYNGFNISKTAYISTKEVKQDKFEKLDEFIKNLR